MNTNPTFDDTLYLNRQSLQYGLDWWCLNEFIQEIESKFQQPNHIFDFYAFMYHRINGHKALFWSLFNKEYIHAKEEQDEIDEQIRFYNCFLPSLGSFFYAWSIVRISSNSIWMNLIYTQQKTVWLHFIQLMEYLYESCRWYAGLKVTTRRNIDECDVLKFVEIQWLKHQMHPISIFQYTPVSDKVVISTTGLTTEIKQASSQSDPMDQQYIIHIETSAQQNERRFIQRKRRVLQWIMEACLHPSRLKRQYSLTWPIPPSSPPLPSILSLVVRPSAPSTSRISSVRSQFDALPKLEYPPFERKTNTEYETKEEEEEEEIKSKDHKEDEDEPPKKSVRFNLRPSSSSSSSFYRNNNNHDNGDNDDDDNRGRIDTGTLQTYYLEDDTNINGYASEIKPMYDKCILIISDFTRFEFDDIEFSLLTQQSLRTMIFLAHWASLLYNQHKNTVQGRTGLTVKTINTLESECNAYVCYMKSIRWNKI